MPPQARFDDCCEVTEAKSPRSISATFAPRAASAAAETAPLIPPPRTRTSNRCSASRRMLVSRNLRYGIGRRYTGGMLLAAACALLTAAEIEKVQGESPVQAKPSEAGASQRCFFELPTFTKSISLEVTRGAPVNELWKKSLHIE